MREVHPNKTGCSPTGEPLFPSVVWEKACFAFAESLSSHLAIAMSNPPLVRNIKPIMALDQAPTLIAKGIGDRAFELTQSSQSGGSNGLSGDYLIESPCLLMPAHSAQPSDFGFRIADFGLPLIESL